MANNRATRSWVVVAALAAALPGCTSSPEPAASDDVVFTFELLGSGDAGDPLAPVSLEWSAAPVVCPAGAADAGVAPTAGALSAQLGVLGSDDAFVVPPPGSPLEIVYGLQGGIHVEVAFELTVPEELESQDVLRVQVEGQVVEPCCDGETVAGSRIRTNLVYAREEDGRRISVAFPVVFEETDPARYAGRECCVALRLGVRRPGEQEPSLWTMAGHRFQCVESTR